MVRVCSFLVLALCTITVFVHPTIGWEVDDPTEQENPDDPFPIIGSHSAAGHTEGLYGMRMEDYHSHLHWRFHNGVVDDGQGGLVSNRDFIGDSFGWTGGHTHIGRLTPRPGVTGERSWWVTVVAPSFGLTASHTSNDLLPNMPSVSEGRQIRFYHTDDPAGTYEDATVKKIHRVVKFEGTYESYTSDLSLVEFEAPVSNAVRKMRIRLPAEGGNFVGEDILVVGRDWHYPNVAGRPRMLSQRFGVNTIHSTGYFQITSPAWNFKSHMYQFNWDSAFSSNPGQASLTSGDSGAPNFLRRGASMHLIGINVLGGGSGGSINKCVAVYHYVDEIQALINSTGSTETLIVWQDRPDS